MVVQPEMEIKTDLLLDHRSSDVAVLRPNLGVRACHTLTLFILRNQRRLCINKVLKRGKTSLIVQNIIFQDFLGP